MAPAWKWKTAGAIATIVQVAGAMSLLRVILPEDSWFTGVADIVGFFFGLPIDGNLFIALVFFVLGAALRRHKRAALGALLLFQVTGLLSVVSIMVILAVAPEEVLQGDDEVGYWVFLGAGCRDLGRCSCRCCGWCGRRSRRDWRAVRGGKRLRRSCWA